MPNGPGTYGPGLLGLFPQKGGQFFAGAAEGLLKNDDARTVDITKQLQALKQQRDAFERVLKIATKMGEDVSPVMPMMQWFEEEQKRIMQTLGGNAMLPSSATQMTPQIPRPTLPTP